MNPQMAQDLLTFLNSDNVNIPGSKSQWHFAVCQELAKVVREASLPKEKEPAPVQTEDQKMGV